MISTDLFSRLQNAVLRKRPFLDEIIHKRGSKSLYKYATDYISVNLNRHIEDRQEQFLATLEATVAERLGKTIAAEVSAQLRQYYVVSTSDHHGPVCSPFFLNSNLMMSAPYGDAHDPTLKYCIALSCANVSLNNSSLPRGLLFHAMHNNEITTQRLSFLPSNAHSSAVYNFRSYTKRDVEKMKTLLRDKERDQLVTTAVAEKITSLLDEVYSQPDVLDCPTYSDQIVKTNYALWQRFFTANHGEPSELIYIEQESLVTRLLLDHHLNHDTTLSHILFDADYESLINQYFEGIMGAYDRTTNTGTYLFWGMSGEKNYRVQLWRQGQELIAADGSVRIPLTPAGLREALQQQRIIPSMLLIFIVLCFYYGLKCLGGFNQVNYLTQMKNAYIKMMVDRGNYKSVEVCARAQTKELNDGITLAFASTATGALTPAFGLDLYLYGDDKTWQTILDEMHNITFAEGLQPLMPEFYKIMYPEVDRVPELASITTGDITKLIGLDNKIKPCITLTE